MDPPPSLLASRRRTKQSGELRGSEENGTACTKVCVSESYIIGRKRNIMCLIVRLLLLRKLEGLNQFQIKMVWTINW